MDLSFLVSREVLGGGIAILLILAAMFMTDNKYKVLRNIFLTVVGLLIIVSFLTPISIGVDPVGYVVGPLLLIGILLVSIYGGEEKPLKTK